MLKVGLTGSIAVGKSHVCEVFRELGCHVLDSDRTARDVVAVGTPGLEAIVEAFGIDILTTSGELDRRKMASIVFDDEAKRLLLNSIVHPLVIAAQDRWLEDRETEDPSGIALIDAALMIESGGYKRFDKLIVVWCEPDIQLRRLTERDGISETEAKKRIAAQMPQEEKKLYADFLIDTSGDYAATRAQCESVHSDLLKLVHA